MDKLVSIIIPTYNESEETVLNALNSIDLQRGIAKNLIEIIVVNDDGSFEPTAKTNNILNKFDSKFIKMEENAGPGIARQVGIDNAIGKYVTFIDADDIYENAFVMMNIANELVNLSPAYLSSNWKEEVKTADGGMAFLDHGIENTWMFGKFLNREFLIKNDIKFHSDLRVHEDSYFLKIAMALAGDNARFYNGTTYLWQYQDNSITRINNGAYTYNSFPIFLKAIIEANKVLEKKNIFVQKSEFAQFIFYAYFSLLNEGYEKEEFISYKKEAEKLVKSFIERYIAIYESISAEEFAHFYNAERTRINFIGIEKENIYDWLERVKTIS